jgi:hypothetical protein
MKEALNLATKTIERAGDSPPVVLPRRVHGDDGLHSARPNRLDDVVRVVARVSNQRIASCVFNQVLRLHRIMLLAGRQNDVERFACCRRDRMDFGRKASSRTAQSIAADPPFPPAASWCARTTEPSMREPTSSTSTRSSLKSRSQMPRFDQRSKRLYTVFQLPYRSGMSRHGAPVFTRHRTALTKKRSPLLAGGPRLTRRSGLICSHCSSVNSCRRTRSVDQIQDRAATLISAAPPKPDFQAPAHFLDLEIRDTP